MPKKYLPGCRQLRPQQVRFIRRLERGDLTAEQVLVELKLNSKIFGQWLQKPIFLRRYRFALQQVQARAASLEATALFRHAQKRLTADPTPATGNAPQSPKEPILDPQSTLAQHLTDLHGSESAAIQKIKHAIKLPTGPSQPSG